MILVNVSNAFGTKCTLICSWKLNLHLGVIKILQAPSLSSVLLSYMISAGGVVVFIDHSIIVVGKRYATPAVIRKCGTLLHEALQFVCADTSIIFN